MHSLLLFEKGHFLESQLYFRWFAFIFFRAFFIWLDTFLEELIKMLISFEGFVLLVAFDHLLFSLEVFVVFESELAIFLLFLRL